MTALSKKILLVFLVLFLIGSVSAVVDGFEDGDISEYSGDTSVFNTNDSVSLNGSWSAYGQDPGSVGFIWRTDSDYTLSPGENVSVWARDTDNDAGASSGVSICNNSGACWFLMFNGKAGGIDIQGYDGSTEVGTYSESVSLSEGAWYKLTFNRDNSTGEMNGWIFDTNGNMLQSISATDTDLSGTTYAGLRKFKSMNYDDLQVGSAGSNSAPTISNEDPVDGATGVNDTEDSSPVDVNLSVQGDDSDGDSLDFYFYDNSSDSLIGSKTGVSSGNSAQVVWENLSSGTSYSWYAKVGDGQVNTTSDTYSFTTNTSTSNDSVDTFEDGDISEYSGDTGLFSINSTISLNGSNSLENSGGSTHGTIYRTDSAFTVGNGENVTGWVYEPDDTGSNSGIAICNSNNGCYYLQIDGDQSGVTLQGSDDGNSFFASTSTSVTTSGGNWYRMVVNYNNSNDELNGWIYDEAGSVLGSVSTTDGTLSSIQYVGVRGFKKGYYDDLQAGNFDPVDTGKSPSFSNFKPSFDVGVDDMHGDSSNNPVANLSVYVEDVDSSSVNVSFYNASDDSVVGSADNVINETVQTQVTGNFGEEFTWYVEAQDENNTATSSDRTFRFLRYDGSKSDFGIFKTPDSQNYLYDGQNPQYFYNQSRYACSLYESGVADVYVHNGDVVATPNSTLEWNRANTSISILDDCGMPYMLAVGNHDMEGVAETRNHSFYNTYFPESRVSDEEWYGGSRNGELDQYYITVNGSGNKDYAFLTIEFCPTQGMVDWANSTAESLANRNVMFNTHHYLDDDGTRIQQGGSYACDNYGISGHEGEQMWNEFVKYQSNVWSVVSGHNIGGTDARLVSTDVAGNSTLQYFTNYQMSSFSDTGGDGYYNFMRIDESSNQVEVDTYSPSLDSFLTSGSNEYTESIDLRTDRDTLPPSLAIHSPQNQTYSSSSVDLNVTSSENANFTYNTDGSSNTTVNENDQDLNTSLTGLSEGSHTVNVYANDSTGNIQFSSQTFTVKSEAVIEFNGNIQINQTGYSNHNTFINVTKNFNVSSLKVYGKNTSFGGVNWSITGNKTDRIVIELLDFNSSAATGEYLANYSIVSGIGNQIKQTFHGVTNDVFHIDKDQSFYTQKTPSNNFFNFNYTTEDAEFTNFTVLNSSNYYPEIKSGYYKLNQSSNTEQIHFTLDSFGENDVTSSQGIGTETSLTNTSMIYSVSLPVQGEYNATDTDGFTSAGFQVDLNKTDTGLTGNGSYSHNFSSQGREQEINLTNNENSQDIDYNVTNQLGNNYRGTVNTGGTVSISDGDTGDFINENIGTYQVTDSEVVLGFNYTSIYPLEANNTVAANFTGVDTSALYTEKFACSTFNNSAVNVDGNTDHNFAIGQTCDPGSKGNPVQTVNNVSTDTERVWYNSTDMNISSNETSDTNIVIRADKNNVKNPDNRDGDSLKAIVEGVESSNNNNLNVTDTGSFFRITVGDIQSSSLYTDDSDWSVTYTLSGDATQAPLTGGGGGTDPTSESQIVFFGNAETSDGLETVNIPFGTEVTRNMTVTNERQSSVTARVSIPDDSQGVCRFITVQRTQSSDEFTKTGQYDLEAATQELGTIENTEEFQIKYNIPTQENLTSMGISDLTCEFETSSSYGTAEPLVVDVSRGFQVQDVIDFLATDYCFDIPVGEVGSELSNIDDGVLTVCVSVWQFLVLILAVFFGLVFYGSRGGGAGF